MVNRMRGTIYLNFSGLAYTLLIILIYFIRPRTNSNEQKVYGLILISSFFELLMGLLSTYAIYYNASNFLINLTGKLFLFSTLLWIELFTIYIICISKYCSKKGTIISVICTSIISTVLLFLLPLNYIKSGNIIYSEGLASVMTYLFAFVCVIICVILALKNRKEKDKRFLPLWLFITLGFIIMIIQIMKPEVFLIVPFEPSTIKKSA